MTVDYNQQRVGSPPRMRGKAAIPARRVPAAGITPAYAGKRAEEAEEDKMSWDHPRVCGEKPYFVDLL